MFAAGLLRTPAILGILGITFLTFIASVRATEVSAGSTVTFSVTADGSAPFSYQWQKDSVNIAGATIQTFRISSFQTGDAGTYTVTVSNSAGSTKSAPATVTVKAATAATAPAITSQPVSQIVTAGEAASFSVAASGDPAPAYQWQRGGANLSGATGATLSIPSAQAADAGNYTVVVSNSAGSVTSGAASLTVQPAPVTPVTIVIPTTSQIVTTGHTVTFTASGAADGGQWQVSNDGGSTWSNLSAGGAYRNVTAATLEITGVTAAMNNNRYRYVTAAGTSNAVLLTVAATFFPFPVGLAADSAGNLYVSDTAADTVQKISGNGTVVLLAGTAGQIGTTDGTGTGARFNDPAGLAAAPDGTVSVADYANGTIRRITPAGAVTTLAGSTTTRGNADGTGTAATFSSPLGVALDGNGNLYVADALNSTVRKVTADGGVTTVAGKAGVTGSTDATGTAARFNHPTGIAVDSAGNVYVADATNNTIRKIAPAGAVTTLAGLAGVSGSSDGAGNGALFNNPGGLAVDPAGNVYVADTGNSTIRKVTPAGNVTTLAGLPGIAGLMDGTGGTAWFNQPQGLARDASGALYVTDTGNAAIRKVTPAGTVTTLSLTAGPAPTQPTDTAASSSSGTGSTAPTSGGSTSTAAPSTGSGGGGGGGALGSWFAAALGVACLLRRAVRPR